MLDVSLEGVSFTYGVREVTLTFRAGTHTAVVGPPGCGASTLLRIIAGELSPTSGEITIGTRVVTGLAFRRSPILYVTSAAGVPERWSVRHALVAAVRRRTLDRVDRQHELKLAAEKWQLTPLLDRPLRTLSSTEQARVHLARIELLRPGIVVADRLLERVNPTVAASIADEIHRTLRVMGATVISAPASVGELGSNDNVVVLDGGRVVQRGTPAQVYARPVSEAAALATGEVNVVPLTIRGRTVGSVIGSWELDPPPFQGSGVALARPEAFAIAKPGEESDLIFGIEEASFSGGRWMLRGLLSGGIVLRVAAPPTTPVQKGKLLPLRFEPAALQLVPGGVELRAASVPTDVVPPMRETR